VTSPKSHYELRIIFHPLQKLGFDKFSILGWSNGGITGGHIAADYPDRVKKLVTWGAHSFADERAVMFTKSEFIEAF